MNKKILTNDKQRIYDIDTMIEKTSNMENVSVGGSKCYDFGNVVLVKYISRDEAEKVKELADKLHEDGVPNICRYLQIKREMVDDKSICWVLQEKAKGVPCTKYQKMNKAEDKVLGLIADYPNLKYLGQDKHLIYGVPKEHIRDMLYSTYRLMNVGLSLEPKNKNVFYDAENGYTHIDFLYRPDFLQDLLPWEKCETVLRYASITMLTALPKWVSPEILTKMNENLRQCAYEILPDYSKFAHWLEKKVPQNAIEMQKYVEGLKIIRSAEIKRNAQLVMDGKKTIRNCSPSALLQNNIEFIPPHNVDVSQIDEDDYEYSCEQAIKNAFDKEMRAEIKASIVKEQQISILQEKI